MMRYCDNCKHSQVRAYAEPCASCRDLLMWEADKFTNADLLRDMTDEELARWIIDEGQKFGEELEGYMSLLDWLRQEAEA